MMRHSIASGAYRRLIDRLREHSGRGTHAPGANLLERARTRQARHRGRGRLPGPCDPLGPVLSHVAFLVVYAGVHTLRACRAPSTSRRRTGYLGVDLFFAISGFVLFFPHAERALHGGRTQTTREYAVRRFIKIVPSYFLALAVTIPAVLSLPPPHAGTQIAGTFGAARRFHQQFFRRRFRPSELRVLEPRGRSPSST